MEQMRVQTHQWIVFSQNGVNGANALSLAIVERSRDYEKFREKPDMEVQHVNQVSFSFGSALNRARVAEHEKFREKPDMEVQHVNQVWCSFGSALNRARVAERRTASGAVGRSGAIVTR